MSSPMRIILMACGSFSPPTPMHLRMFEIARDHYMQMGTHNVIGGVISPVHDSYGKKGLIPSKHRLAMVKLALQSSNWINLSDWECLQQNWTRTRDTLQYHQNYVNSYINDINGNLNEMIPSWIPKGIKQQNGNIQFKLLCGADLLESFAVPGLWAEEDIESILGQHGLVVISRSGSNPEKFIFDSDLLSKHRKNITIITNWVPNEVSSTVARRFLSRGLSVKYLLDDIIIEYIKQYNLYGINDAKYILTSNSNNNNNNNFKEILLTSSIYEQQQQQQQIQLHTQNYISKNNTININNNNNNNSNNNNKINTYLKKYNLTNSYYNDMDVTDYSSHKSLVVNSLDENAKDVARPKVFCCDPLNVKSLINRPGQAVQILSNNTIIDTTNHHCIMKTTKHNRHYGNTNDVSDNNNNDNDNNDADNANDVLSNKDAIVYNADANNNNNDVDDDVDDVDEVGENKLTTITLSASTSIPSSSSSSFTTSTTTTTTTPTTAITTCNNSNNGTISNNNSKIDNCNKKLLRKFEYLSDSHLDKINILESCLLNSLSEREMPSTSTRDQNDLIQFVFTAHGIRVISDKEYVV